MAIPAVAYFIFILLAVAGPVHGSRSAAGEVLRLPSEASRFFRTNEEEDNVGTRWAVLVAGSNGYWNYRHQVKTMDWFSKPRWSTKFGQRADVCHAYQILKKGGLKNENIIVFMYDDIAYDMLNPRPGVIINSPNGSDVYKGVPKDYTGEDVTVNNFYAAILGNKTAITGGSGKVVDSGPDDHIFIYYTDHGGPGVLGMPTYPYVYADDLIAVLKKKHALGSYKSLVFYVEACESGSIFEGLLPEGLNIYAATASRADEDSYGTYCPGDYPGPPEEFDTCLGDMFSVAWLEDSEMHDLRKETLKQQYEVVKERTANVGLYYGSHVMHYGDMGISDHHLYRYMGTNPANDGKTFVGDNLLMGQSNAVNQRDADLIHFWDKFRKAPEGSERKIQAQKQLVEVMSHRMHVDNSIKLIGKLLFGSPENLHTVRPAGQPLADDWRCLKDMVRTFELHCGSLSQYGMKHMRFLANICNVGTEVVQMADAAAQACVNIPPGPWSSLNGGLSA